MTRILGMFLYVTSLIAVLGTGAYIAQLIEAFPVEHLASNGPRIPAVAALNARWLPHAPVLLFGAAAVSVLATAGIWRSRSRVSNRPFALAALAAANYFLSLYCSMTLLVAWFLLPRMANMG
jgi:uncharacterized membrane protein YozB (DUF420 family)